MCVRDHKETDDCVSVTGKDSLKFPKRERLHHRVLVDSVFEQGQKIYDFPLKMTWRTLDGKTLESSFRNGIPEGIGRMQMMVTVPKKKLRHAVDRVLMRRRIREAYRLNRIPLRDQVYSTDNLRLLAVAFVYVHDKVLPYEKVEAKMKKMLQKLKNNI